tara:strand:+ start:2688 stop:3911 length:1224 start_codon:yes stop_codon:yes gene_type:complete
MKVNIKKCFKSLLVYLLVFTTSYALDDCVQYFPRPATNNFSIVIDKSGSMSGRAMNDAINAVENFINKMRIDDKANIIVFDTYVSVLSDLTSSKGELKDVVRTIRPGSSTALYDGIAKSASSLKGVEGSKIIIFLTDGRDNESRFKLKDISNMNISEGIFIYGIGLGNVDAQNLNDLAKATNGEYYHVSKPNDLTDIYNKVIKAYYNDYGNTLSETGSVLIHSIPSHRPVYIEGRKRGKTPFKLDRVSEGEYDVNIKFDKGDWSCGVDVVSGQKAIIDARDSDVGYDLTIISQPKGASIFLDDEYVGMTATKPTSYNTHRGGFFSSNTKTTSWDGEYKIPKIQRGKHQLRVVAVPEEGIDMGFDYTFDFEMKNSNRFVNVSLLKLNHEFKDGETGKKLKDPFESFNK